MSFEETILAASVGSFIGFLGALAIFFIKEWRTDDRRRTSIVKNLKYELEYNINLYEKFESQIQDCIEEITNDIRNVYLNLNYDFVGHNFAQQFYREGLLLKYFHPEDMRRWNVILSQISGEADTYVTESIEKWRENKIDKEAVFKALRHEKGQVAYAKEMSEYILAKL